MIINEGGTAGIYACPSVREDRRFLYFRRPGMQKGRKIT
jgi:hypothetical protein